jgi:hypothetical protein
MRLTRGDIAVELDDRFPRVRAYVRGGSQIEGDSGSGFYPLVLTARSEQDEREVDNRTAWTIRSGADWAEYDLEIGRHEITFRFELCDGFLRITMPRLSEVTESVVFHDYHLATARVGQSFLRHVARRANWSRTWCPGTATYDRWEDFGLVEHAHFEPGAQHTYHTAIWTEGMCLAFWSSVMVEPWETFLQPGPQHRCDRFTVTPGVFTPLSLRPFEIRIGILGDYDGDGTIDWTDAANWEGDQTFEVSPYSEMYREVLVYKLGLDEPGRAKPSFTFDQVLERVRMVQEVSKEVVGGERGEKEGKGLKQILYLVGWQRGGHDCLYPDHSMVNERCGTAEDLRRLVREARKHNCIVSLHGNLDDALPGEPMFDEAPLSRREDGSAAVWFKSSLHGKDTFSINHTLSVRQGFHRKRLEQMRALIPELRETIHFDAHRPYNETFHDGEFIGAESEVEAMRQTQELFRHAGLDITTEDTDSEKRGLYAWTWIGPHWLCPYVTVMHHGRQGSLWRAGVPTARGGQVNCGEARALGLGFFHTEGPADTREQVLKHLVSDWMYAQVLQRRKMTSYQTLDWNTGVVATYTDGKTRGGRPPGAVETELGGILIARGEDRFLPWREDEIVFYSAGGGEQAWDLPKAWAGHAVTSNLPIELRNGKVHFTAAPGELRRFLRGDRKSTS